MPSLIETISLRWDLWIGPYRAYFPTGKGEQEACRRLVAAAGAIDGTSTVEGVPDVSSLLAACQDTTSGELVVCVRLYDAEAMQAVAGKTAQFRLDIFEPEQRSNLVVFSQLAIHPQHEKSQAALLLLSHCFVEVLKAGGQAAVMSGDPGHYGLYKRVGMRPLGPLGKTPEGLIRLPMILLPDREYLTLINAPVLPMMRSVDFSAYRPFCEWYDQLVRDQQQLRTGATPIPEKEEAFAGHALLTDGLSPAGREALLQHAVMLKCEEGEVLISENDGGKAFGFVQKGVAKVIISDKTSVLLGEGDIFGEIAFVLHTHRTARVVAASPDTEVVLFSESAIDYLENAADRTVIWRNLARVLAQRVRMTNKLLG